MKLCIFVDVFTFTGQFLRNESKYSVVDYFTVLLILLLGDCTHY